MTTTPQAIKVLLLLARLLAIAALAVQLVFIASMGAQVLWALVAAVPVLLVLVVVGVALVRRGDRAAVGHGARRALACMLAVLAILADGQIGATDTTAHWVRPLFDLPNSTGGMLTVAAMAAIRIFERGRARYIVPVVVATPTIMLAIADSSFRAQWILVSAALLLYAAAMVSLQSFGIGIRSSSGQRGHAEPTPEDER